MHRVVLATILVLSAAARAAAQPHAYFTGLAPEPFNRDVPVVAVDLATNRVLWQADSGDSGRVAVAGGIVVTADARYVAWPAARFATGASFTDHALVARDSLTGSFVTVPIAGQPIRVLAHPRKLAVYLIYSTSLIEVVSPTGRESLLACANNRDAVFSADGSQLLVACAENKVVVLSLATHTVSQTIATAAPVVFIAAGGGGSHIAVATRNESDRSDSVVVYHAGTGTEVARLALQRQGYADAHVTLLRADTLRQRLYASVLFSNFRSSFVDETLVLDFDTLTSVGTVASGFHDIDFNQRGDRAIGLRVSPLTFLNTSVRPYIIDTETLQLAPLAGSFYAGDARVVTADAPLAPTGVNASMAGRHVTLTWALPPQSSWVTSWQIEARLAAGGPIVATLDIAPEQQPLDFANVPTGTYLVRLRGVNAIGAGAWSAPLTVVVP